MDHDHEGYAGAPIYKYGSDYHMPLIPEETEDPEHVLFDDDHFDAETVLGHWSAAYTPDERDLMVHNYQKMQHDYYQQYWGALCEQYSTYYPEAYDECYNSFNAEQTKHIIGLALAQQFGHLVQ